MKSLNPEDLSVEKCFCGETRVWFRRLTGQTSAGNEGETLLTDRILVLETGREWSHWGGSEWEHTYSSRAETLRLVNKVICSSLFSDSRTSFRSIREHLFLPFPVLVSNITRISGLWVKLPACPAPSPLWWRRSPARGWCPPRCSALCRWGLLSKVLRIKLLKFLCAAERTKRDDWVTTSKQSVVLLWNIRTTSTVFWNYLSIYELFE